VKIVLAYKTPADRDARDNLRDAFTRTVNAKKRELVNYMQNYFAGCRLEEVGGAKNHARIQREIRDKMNDMLWPQNTPWIDHVLFEQWMVQ
jgi:flagellar basal body-associated protein FliL